MIALGKGANRASRKMHVAWPANEADGGRVAPEAIVLSGPGARLPGSVPTNGHWGVSVV